MFCTLVPDLRGGGVALWVGEAQTLEGELLLLFIVGVVGVLDSSAGVGAPTFGRLLEPQLSV